MSFNLPFLYPSITVNRTLAETLLDEFYMLQDLNGDGMIYGYDFMIKGEKPQFLTDLESNIYWRTPKKNIPSWESYVINNLEELS